MSMNTYKITLLGSEQSGKTCFLAGLGILSEGDRKSNFHLSSQSESKQFIYELSSTLRSQNWPPGTSKIRRFEGDLRYKGKDLHLDFVEYAGEFFREAYATGKQISEDLNNSIQESDYLLVTLDPIVDLNHSKNLGESVEDKNRFISRLDSLLEALHQITLHRGNEKPLKLGIMIMKGDQVSEDLANPKKAEEYMQEAAPAFYERLKRDFPNSRIFGMSSVGYTEENNAGELIPASHLEPWGYEKLFDWIIKDIKHEKMKPIYKLMASSILAAFVIGIAWMSFSLIQENEKYEQWQTLVRRGIEQDNIIDAERVARQISLDNYQLIVDERLDKTLSLINDSKITTNDLIYLLNSLKSLSQTNKTYKILDINNAIKKCNEILQEKDFLLVKRAYENNLSDFQGLIQDFLKKYPNSPHRATLEEWAEQKIQNQIKKDALKIYSIEANSLEALTNKAQAILQFIQRYPNLAYSADMKEAANHTMRLVKESKNNEFVLELRSLGTLVDDEGYLTLEISVDDKLVVNPPQSDKLTIYSFENDKTHSFPWNPNQKILLEVDLEGDWGWLSADEEAAEKILDNNLALMDIDGEIKLNPIDEGVNVFANNQPILKCDVLNWEDEHWQLISDWISPGDKWLEIENNG